MNNNFGVESDVDWMMADFTKSAHNAIMIFSLVDQNFEQLIVIISYRALISIHTILWFIHESNATRKGNRMGLL